jgi:hypothetical protein
LKQPGLWKDGTGGDSIEYLDDQEDEDKSELTWEKPENEEDKSNVALQNTGKDTT